MITFLDGILDGKQPTAVTVNVSGVGYSVAIPLSSYDCLPAPGESVRILTHLVVRDDAHLLYGFMTEAERDTFRLLLTISGIGPKIALSALSGLHPRELNAAIVSGDTKRLSSVSGIGKKMAERMVVELRDKIPAADAIAATGLDAPGKDDLRLRDATLALVGLGYRQEAAAKMVRKVTDGADSTGLSVEELVKRALVG